MSVAIKFENVSKQYRLGEVGTGTLSHDLHRAWARMWGKPDPFAKVGAVNDRTVAGGEYVYALKDIDFEVQQGEILGIIGRNGAGKSTLLKLLSRVTAPTSGSIKAKGRIASLLEVGTGFHPELTGRENIYLNGAILGMRRHEITKQLDAIVDFSGCAKYIDTPAKRYSSGMTVRLGFAVAAHLDCEILVVDEVLAVGDSEFQKRCVGKMQEVSYENGKTVLFVSHNLGTVSDLCTDGIVLKQGEIGSRGSIEESIQRYLCDQKKTGIASRNFEKSNREGFCFISASVRNEQFVSDRFSTKERVFVNVTANLAHSIVGLDVAMLLFNEKAQRVFTSERSSEISTPIPLGRTHLSIAIPGNLLVPGQYFIRLVASIPGTQIVQDIPNAVAFEVYDGGYHFSRYHGVDIGNVLVKCEWEEWLQQPSGSQEKSLSCQRPYG